MAAIIRYCYTYIIGTVLRNRIVEDGRNSGVESIYFPLVTEAGYVGTIKCYVPIDRVFVDVAVTAIPEITVRMFVTPVASRGITIKDARAAEGGIAMITCICNCYTNHVRSVLKNRIGKCAARSGI
jgi:hypothetical protein